MLRSIRSDQMPWRRMAWQFLALGLVMVCLITAVAVGHYLFGVPIHEGHATPPRLATPAEILTILVALGGGGGLFAGIGAAILLLKNPKTPPYFRRSRVRLNRLSV